MSETARLGPHARWFDAGVRQERGLRPQALNITGESTADAGDPSSTAIRSTSSDVSRCRAIASSRIWQRLAAEVGQPFGGCLRLC